MEREIIRVEPFDTSFEKWGAPVSVCTRAGHMVFVSGLPPRDRYRIAEGKHSYDLEYQLPTEAP